MSFYKPSNQRDSMRALLRKHGYNKEAVCAAYAERDRTGRIPGRSNINGMTSEAYANEVWADGHQRRSP